MNARVEVVAVGARTPVGLSAESSAASVRAGICRYAEYPFVDPRGERVVVAADRLLPSRLEGRNRLMPMIRSVLEEIEAKLGQALLHGGGLEVLLALPEVRPGFSEEDEVWVMDALASHLRTRMPHARIELAGRGHAGALRAVELAIQACLRRENDLFLVVGADSYHHAETFAWLERHRRFAQPGIRNGFTPGEGVGCLALVSTGLRRRLRLSPLAAVHGASTAWEQHLRDSDTGSFGMGMTQAVRGTSLGEASSQETVDEVYSDINGERYRSEEWGFVTLRVPSVAGVSGYKAPSECWGDVGAASGALGGVLAVRAFARGYARGPRALVVAGSDSGLRGAMLLQAPRVA